MTRRKKPTTVKTTGKTSDIAIADLLGKPPREFQLSPSQPIALGAIQNTQEGLKRQFTELEQQRLAIFAEIAKQHSIDVEELKQGKFSINGDKLIEIVNG